MYEAALVKNNLSEQPKTILCLYTYTMLYCELNLSNEYDNAHQDINSEVVFGVVDEVRLGDVLLHDQGALLWDLRKNS